MRWSVLETQNVPKPKLTAGIEKQNSRPALMSRIKSEDGHH